MVLLGLLEDKFTQVKEGMLMMGLQESSYWLAWYLFALIIIFFVATIAALVLSFAIFSNQVFTVLWLYFILYGHACFGFSILVASIFASPRNGITIGIMLYYLLFYLGYLVDNKSSEVVMGFVSLIPGINMQ